MSVLGYYVLIHVHRQYSIFFRADIGKIHRVNSITPDPGDRIDLRTEDDSKYLSLPRLKASGRGPSFVDM